MENATKALLIAAAVLVAILIISLGLVVYNMAAETVGKVNMNEQEIQAHNDKFTRYVGNSQRGSQVNGLLNAVLTHNLAETDDARKVTVYYGNTTSVYLNKTANSSPKKVDTGKTYTVTAIYGDSSLITGMLIKQN